MIDAEDQLRSFGMSGYLVVQDLHEVEQKFNVDLGHGGAALTEAPIDYYPQFEKEVRAEALAMARHYEVFYCLERSIRSMITETLQEAYGETWWESGKIPLIIASSAKGRQQEEIDNGTTPRSDAALDYTNFGELQISLLPTGHCLELFLRVPKPSNAS